MSWESEYGLYDQTQSKLASTIGKDRSSRWIQLKATRRIVEVQLVRRSRKKNRKLKPRRKGTGVETRGTIRLVRRLYEWTSESYLVSTLLS